MRFRLRQIELTAEGREIVRERLLDQPVLTIGRASENDVHLPDLAIEPRHATLAEAGHDRVEARATGTLGFGLDGVTVLEAAIDCRVGAELRFGTYRMTIVQDETGAVLLTIRQPDDATRGRSDEKRDFSLAGVLPGKRTMSWISLLLILAVFLAFPIASHLRHQVDPRTGVSGDRSWSPGKLSAAHHMLETKCESCHVDAFESVRDTACVTCHKDTHDHADLARLSLARGEGSLGDRASRAVAHLFGKPGPGACVDCHREHEGAGPMAQPAQQFCADCHGVLKAQLPSTKLADASDFGRQHPQFTPAVVTDPLTRKRAPVSLDSHPRESNGLTFAHKIHLDPRGGVARMAASIGGNSGHGAGGLQCKDCHRASEDGVRFQPVNMERDCENCHSLAYDTVGGTVRRLKHGDVDQMVADLSVADFPRGPATDRDRPGEFAPGRRYYSNFGPSVNGTVIRAALSRDGVCGECHTPTMKAGRPAVVPVTLVPRYMGQGWFDHKAHRQQTCISCHAAPGSTTSSDVLLPGIGQCRTCHLGEDAAGAVVPSTCAMCHTFHPTQGVPRRVPRNKT
jgi:predicted CXXCH cytochrome family protein